MFEIQNDSFIIENVISLSKESFFHPFRIEYTVQYKNEKRVRYIKDDRNQVDEYLTPGPLLESLLSIIVEEKIMSYPFEERGFNRGTPIDIIDLYTTPIEDEIETTIDFIKYLRETEYIDEIVVEDTEEVNNWVEAPHLTKFQLTFEKASDLSTVSFKMFSRYPVKLLSLVSERDLMGTGAPEKINLNNTSLSIDGDTVTVILGKPIYTKRLTFVLGQFNADDNIYSEGGYEYE